ncbi:MAG: uroporphyrinogen decarboxylase [Bacteroidetes bacterium]|nr:uroporphyrinogen decarboxylase [Bacteroidota bacterium]
MQFTLTEIIGYFASLGVLVSFLMKDITRLRIINTIGCCLFVAYGIMLQYSIPIIITNVTIIGINLYYLVKAKNQAN